LLIKYISNYSPYLETGLIWLRIRTVKNFLEHGNELSGSVKCWESLDQLSNS
jgi:hypothetical protein